MKYFDNITKSMDMNLSIFPEILRTEELGIYSIWGHTELDMTEAT